MTVSVTSFCVITTIKTNPKREEKINIIIGSYDAKVSQLENELKKNKPQSIKEINVNYLNLHAVNFNYLFSSLRGESDLFILPINYALDNLDSTIKYAANIDEEYVNQQVGKSLDYYSYESYKKGFKIYDSSSQTGALTNYITYEEDNNKSDYYMFLTYNSKNIGKLNNSKSERAYGVIKELLDL